MKFANIVMKRNGRCTVGDDIQLLAIENLYKYMGINYDDVIRISFNELHSYSGEYCILPISFPLYGFSHEHFVTCFSERIIPVFLGMATMIQDYCNEDIQYLKKFEPIGCRDQYTMKNLRKNGISSYLNGCMTITLPRVRDGYDNRKKIYCIDLTDDIIQNIPKDILSDCIFKSHVYMSDECPDGTENMAKRVYREYIDNAKMIITTRMHAALPCIAFGIPVVLAKKRMSIRFPIIEKYIPIYTEDEYANINWNPKNVDIEDLKEKILKSAAKQIMDAYNKYKDIYDISMFYENDNIKDEYIDNFSDVIPYLNNRFNKDDCFEYVLWGATQTAQLVKKYIVDNFPNAKLCGIIDEYKKIIFLGCETKNKDILKDFPNSICIVCAGAAMPEANKFCEEIGHVDLFSCWEDGLKR